MKKYILIFTTFTIIAVLLKIMKLGSLFTILSIPFTQNSALERPKNLLQNSTIKHLYDFNLKSLDGKMVDLSIYKGKKVIILNTASKCGFTPQYEDWETFYKTNKENVVVLGFPADNFGNQEPGKDDEIANFCQKNYGVSFPMFSKISVKGNDIAPLYKWLSTISQNGWNDKTPTWNFCKYLINEKGELTNFFGSKVTPKSIEFIKALNAL